MGWTFENADTLNHTRLQLVKEMCEWSNDDYSHKVAYAYQNGSVCYLAVRRTHLRTGESTVYGLVVLTAIRNDDYYNFGTKFIEESAGPCYYCAPKKLIAMLSPTVSNYANEWRKTCLENHQRRSSRKKEAALLRSLPLGSVIRVHDPIETRVTPYEHSGRRRYKIVGRWARMSTHVILNYGFTVES